MKFEYMFESGLVATSDGDNKEITFYDSNTGISNTIEFSSIKGAKFENESDFGAYALEFVMEGSSFKLKDLSDHDFNYFMRDVLVPAHIGGYEKGFWNAFYGR